MFDCPLCKKRKQENESTQALFWGRICGDCESGFDRKPFALIATNTGLNKYERDIQSGKIDCPFTVRITATDGLEVGCVLKLNASGKSKLIAA